MPNEVQEREQGPSEAPVARRTRIRPATIGALVAGVALIAVIVGGAVSGGPSSAPIAVLSSAAPPTATPAPAGTALPASGASNDPAASAASATVALSATQTPAPAVTPATVSPVPATATPGPTASAPASPSPSASPGPPEVTLALAAKLDARLRTLLKSSGIPGISAAIVWDDGRRWAGAVGGADLATARAMTPDTAFALASVSKTLTAAVVLQLVGEGSIALDQPVAPLLPVFKLDPRITVRMLLDHTSGLPDYFLNPKIDRPLQAKPDAAWTALQTWRYVPAKRPVPGTTWRYSNSNYMLLGELVRVVTGHPLAAEVRARLLDPLGLSAAWFQVAEDPRTVGATGYKRVPRAGGGSRYVPVAPRSDVMPFRSVVTAAGGAGSIAATAMDAALWMRAFAGGDVLPPDVQAAMIDDAAATKALGAQIPYGLGIQVAKLDGRRALGHSGRYLGFRNVVRYVPAAGVTIAVLTNQGTYDPSKIATDLLRVVAPRPIVAPKPTVAPSPPAP